MKTRVEENIDGHFSVRAVAALESGEVIFTLEGALSDRPSRHSVQIGPDLHLEPAGAALDASGRCRFPWMYTNHSCAPNARIQGREMVALRDIRAGEEITFDYDTNEYDMASPFECHCENESCRGLIRGYRYLDARQRERLAGCVNPALIALAEQETVSASPVGSAD